MTSVLIINLIAVFFAYLSSVKFLKFGLKASFLLIFVFLALRYDYGNDYSSYLDFYLNISNSELSIVDLTNNEEYMEIGWVLLNVLFGSFGFFILIAFLAAFNCTVYYYFIKNHVLVKYYWFATFLYVFYPGFMLIHLSAMRQSVSICIFLLALRYLEKKNAIKYFMLIGVACLFHTSAIILFPIYLLTLIDSKINKKYATLGIVIWISLFLFGDLILTGLSKITSLISLFQRYEVYQNADKLEIGSGFGVLYSTLIFILLLHFEKFQNNKNSLFIKLSIIGYLFIPVSILIPQLSRVSMYFAIVNLISLSNIIQYIKVPIMKISYILMVLFMTAYSFINFFNSNFFSDSYERYKTIFSSPIIY